MGKFESVNGKLEIFTPQVSGEKIVSHLALYRDELRMYLIQRFGSRSLAERILAELDLRLQDSEVLANVGNPLVYLCGFGLSLGMGFVKEELRAYP